MNKEKEKSFIKNFINKRYKDRILWEFEGKKRQQGIDRFCHGIESIVDDRYIVAQSTKMFCKEWLNEIKKYSSSKTCYIISKACVYPGGNVFSLDGQEFEVEEILHTFIFDLFVGSVMIIDPHTVLLRPELRGIYLLYRERILE